MRLTFTTPRIPRTFFSLNQIVAHTISSVIGAGVACAVIFVPELADIAKAASLSVDALDTLRECSGVGEHSSEKDFTYVAGVFRSSDPNDKFGSIGAGPLQYISGVEPLRYEVFFSNLPTATASARKVVVTDRLDPGKVELGTFNFGPILFGSKPPVIPPAGNADFSQTVDLRPDNNLLVKVDGHLDIQSGLVTWTFDSLDPATGQPPSDIFVGFLPPDTTPPVGEGNILFFVMPRVDLSTNTQIQNLARIVFDANTPIDTPTWLNTMDNTSPVSHMLALSSEQVSPTFAVKWSGTDVGSGVRDYTIYASDNGEAFTAWLARTTATSATFTGQIGHTYGFYSIATDNVGNVEASKTVAEGTTTIASSGADVYLRVKPSLTIVHQGDLLTYAFPVWNLGPGDAAQEVLTTLVPEGTTFDYIRVSGTSGLGTCTHPAYGKTGPVVCHENSSMAPNTTWTVRLTVKVTAAAGSTITANAATMADTPDQNLANNTATVSTTVLGNADLFLRVLPSTTTVHQGDLLTYAFPVWNLGPSEAALEVLNTQVPAGTTFDYIRVSGTSGLGTCTHPAYGKTGPVVCHENSSMAPNTTWTVRLTVKVTTSSGAVINESGTVTEDTIDPNAANNTASVNTSVQ